jgi:nucleoside-diphosphate-sugar epimerase
VIRLQFLVTGGGGYVGTRLCPALLSHGHQVRVLDSFLFGRSWLRAADPEGRIDVVVGDIRDRDSVRSALDGVDVVVHLAAMANDPSAELDPGITRAVNRDAVISLVDLCLEAGVGRLVNASSATVYGIRSGRDLDEDAELNPISLYGVYKAETERHILSAAQASLVTTSLRAATVCGVSPRQRLDLTVNLLTAQAVRGGRIRVFGGRQYRPNIHLDDLVDVYLLLATAPAEAVNGRAFNVVGENLRVIEIAQLVREVVGGAVAIEVLAVHDERSYHVSGERIRRELGFGARRTVADAARELAQVLRAEAIGDIDDPLYSNIRWLQASSAGGQRPTVTTAGGAAGRDG